jgi:hypothetical protein
VRSASLRSQSLCERLGDVACCIEWFACTVGIPEGSEGACQKYAHHVASVCVCVPVCHARLSSSTDTDSEQRRPTPGRWLNQSTALSGECSDLPVATTPVPGAQPSASCNGCAGLWPLPFACPRLPYLFPLPKACEDQPPADKSLGRSLVYPSRFARGSACGPSFMCEPVAMIQTSNHLDQSSPATAFLCASC